MMKKIANPVSETILNFRAARCAAVSAATLAVSLGALLPGAAQAQTYIGNAYSINLDANLGVGVTTTTNALGLPLDVALSSKTFTGLSPLAFTGNLSSPAPQQTLTGTGVNAGLNSGLLGLVGLNLVTNDVLNAGVQTTSTTSLTPNAGFGVTSTASVASVGLFNSLTSVVGGILVADPVQSLVSATVIESTTSAKADGSGNVGSSKITDLRVNGVLQNLNNVAGLTVDANGVITGSGTIVVNNFLGTGRLGELRMN